MLIAEIALPLITLINVCLCEHVMIPLYHLMIADLVLLRKIAFVAADSPDVSKISVSDIISSMRITVLMYYPNRLILTLMLHR